MEAFLGYFQLAALTVFTVAVTSRAIQNHRKQRINPIQLTTTGKGNGHATSLPVFLGLTLWIAFVVIYGIGAEEQCLPAFLDIALIDSVVAQVLGVLLILLGLTIFVLALRTLGFSWRLGIDEQHPGELVTWGIYALTRNPIFLFFNLYLAGTFLINGTLVFLLFFIAEAALLHIQLLDEEETLARLFPQAYPQYRASTARYIDWRRIGCGVARMARRVFSGEGTGNNG